MNENPSGERIGLLIAAGLAAGTVVALVANKAMAKVALAPSNAPAEGPPGPGVNLTPPVVTDLVPASNLVDGQTYMIAGPIPGTVTDPVGLNTLFAGPGYGFSIAAGQSSVVSFFGRTDPPSNWPIDLPWPGGAAPIQGVNLFAGMGIFSAQAAGAASPMALPTGWIAFLMPTTPVAIPATPTVIVYKKTPLYVIQQSGLWYGNAQCSKQVATPLGSNVALAIGATSQEVVTKLSAWLDANGC